MHIFGFIFQGMVLAGSGIMLALKIKERQQEKVEEAKKSDEYKKY